MAWLSLRSQENHKNLSAIGLMVLACFWFSLMAMIIRYVSQEVHPFQMVFFRNVFCVICMLPWAFRHGVTNISLHKFNWYFARGVSGVMGMLLFFYGLTHLPVTQVTSLSFMVPIITTLMAVIWLNEKVTPIFWIVLFVSFIGVLVIIRPGTELFDATSFVVIGATFFWAISNIFVKKLTDLHNPKMIVFVMMCIMVPLSFPTAWWAWGEIPLDMMAWIFILGWVTNQGQFALTGSYSRADMKTVMPFDFFRLIFVSIAAYLCFGELIDRWTLVGALIILSSSIIMLFVLTKGRSSVLRSKNKIANRV